MTISPTEAVTGGLFTPPTTDTGNGATKAKDDKQTFLSLLVAQLRYQDPSKPTDSSAFLAQTAQFTALEKMQAVADQTSQLLYAQTAFGASNLVGRSITYAAADGTTTSGTVSGVTFGGAGPMLSVGGTQVPLSNVQSVTDGTTPVAPATPSTAV